MTYTKLTITTELQILDFDHENMPRLHTFEGDNP